MYGLIAASLLYIFVIKREGFCVFVVVYKMITNQWKNQFTLKYRINYSDLIIDTLSRLFLAHRTEKESSANAQKASRMFCASM